MEITPEYILQEVLRIADIFRQNQADGHLKEDAMPEYYPGYSQIVKEYEDICVHAERQEFPERLFKEKSPNMSEDEESYLRENFKNTTQPVFKDMANAVRRAFSEGNWSINYPEEDRRFEGENSFEYYVKEKLDVQDYVRNLIINFKLKDPNGVVCVTVPDIPLVEIDEETGAQVIDPSVMLEPKIYYYESKKVVYYSEHLVLIETGERSLVTYRSRPTQIGLVYEAYTADATYQVRQVGNFQDFEFEIYLQFPHEFGEVPAYRLKGEPFLIDNKVHYQSPFLAAVDLLDLALINKNNVEVSKQLTMYPFRVMVGDPCDFEIDGVTCADGQIQIWDAEGKQKVISCPECHGSGLKTRPHRGGTLLIEQRTTTTSLGGDNLAPSEAIHFAQPSADGLRYVDETIEKDTKAARRILHLREPDDKAQGDDPTATGRMIDREDSYAFIAPISDQTFGIWKKLLQAIGYFRYGEAFKGFTLNKAVNFDFRTKQDYLAEIKFAQEIGDPMLVRNAITDYLGYAYHADVDKATVAEVVIASDRLFAMPYNQIIQGVANKTIEPWEKTLHDSALYFLDQQLIENPEFLSLEITQQVEVLQNAAKEKTPTPQSEEGLTPEERLQRALNGA